MKLLVTTPAGTQELIEVGEGGGYFYNSLVLWDERDDGVLPEITLGAMKRVGGALVYDSALDAGTIAANQAAAHKTSITNQIAALESTITNRRIREAIRGSGKQWLDGVDDQITALRAQL